MARARGAARQAGGPPGHAHGHAARGDEAAATWLREQMRLGAPAAQRQALVGGGQVLLGIAQAWCIATLLGGVLSGDAAQRMLPVLAILAVAGCGRVALRWWADRLAFEAGAAARSRLRAGALARILAAGPGAARDRATGDLVTLVTDQVEALDGFFARWMPQRRLAVVGPLLVLAAAVVADPLAGAVLGGAGLLVPLGMAAAGLGAAAASRRQFTALSRLQARFLDRMRGLSTIVLNNQADAEAAAMERAATELRRRTMRVLRVAFLSSTALDAAMALALVGTALRYGATFSLTDGLFSVLLIPEFFAPLRGFAAVYQDRMAANTAAGVFTALPPVPDAPPVTPVRTVEARGVTVAFDGVGLTWDVSRGPALRNIGFRVPAGETLVLAGPSGAGKSSIIAILLGFAQADEGRVTLNGADLGTILPQALSRMTSWIGQRPALFSGTVRDNIRFARPDATDAEVEAAARNARVLAFTEALPDGLDTRVGEGGYGLSGGQAQRVAIARAYLKNAPLLLMDEPTAHLDPGTEAEVLAALRRLAIGRTVIVASHSAAAHAFGGRRLDLRDGQVLPSRGVA